MEVLRVELYNFLLGMSNEDDRKHLLHELVLNPQGTVILRFSIISSTALEIKQTVVKI
jgi:hypothetical protein